MILYRGNGVCHYKKPVRPHPPSSSPKERRRCYFANTNFITTTSSSYHCSTFLKTAINGRVFEKRGQVCWWPPPWEEAGWGYISSTLLFTNSVKSAPLSIPCERRARSNACFAIRFFSSSFSACAILLISG